MEASWNYDIMEEIQDKYLFVYIGNGYSLIISILDANKYWTKDRNILFHTGYRIAGTQEDIEPVLMQNDINEKEITKILDTAVTYNNYTDEYKEVYDDEVVNYLLWKRGSIKANSNVDGSKLIDIIKALNPLAHLREDVKKSARYIASLQSKLDKLPQDKFLDVSKLKEDGTGVTISGIPTERSKMVWAPTLAIKSSDLDHYLMAIRRLDGGEEKYINEINYVKAKLGIEPSEPKEIKVAVAKPGEREYPGGIKPFRPNKPVEEVEATRVYGLVSKKKREEMAEKAAAKKLIEESRVDKLMKPEIVPETLEKSTKKSVGSIKKKEVKSSKSIPEPEIFIEKSPPEEVVEGIEETEGTEGTEGTEDVGDVPETTLADLEEQQQEVEEDVEAQEDIEEIEQRIKAQEDLDPHPLEDLSDIPETERRQLPKILPRRVSTEASLEPVELEPEVITEASLEPVEVPSMLSPRFRDEDESALIRPT